MRIKLRTKQLFERFKHPMLFSQQVVMSDGSICEMYSLSDKKPVVKLIVDSCNHPTWNPGLTESQAILYKQEQVMKFNKKFEDLNNLDQFTHFIETSSSSTRNTDNIPILEDTSKQQPTEPEWMKYKRAAEEKAKNAPPMKKGSKKK